MNIAITAKKTTLHQSYAGLETQNLVLARSLVTRGHEVTVFSPNWELASGQTLQDGVRYIFVDCVYRTGPVFGFFGTLQKSNWINRSYEEFQKCHKEKPFNLLISQSSSGLGIMKHKAEFGIKVISIAHGTIVGEYTTFVKSLRLPRDLWLLIKNTGFMIKNFFRRQREFVHGSDHVICVSHYIKNTLAEETFAPESKFTVINNGLDPLLFENVPDRSDAKKVLFVGQVISSKGVVDLCEMFTKGPLSQYFLDILGGGDILEQLRNRYKSFPNINILGKVPYSELVNHYYLNPDYALFAFPTKRVEGFPMVLIEAMFSGLPCVAFNLGGVYDAIKNDQTGVLLPGGALQAFENALLDLLQDKQKRMQLSASCHAYAQENFTIDIMVDAYEKVIKEVLK